MKNVEIRLTPAELYVGAQVGIMRRVASLQNGNDKNKHAHKSDWATDADGACAEIAVAKYLGVYWAPAVNTFKAPDLGGIIQVRSTTHAGGHLIVRDNDSDMQCFVLVICASPLFRLIGALTGREAKQDAFRFSGVDGGADCWMVPQGMLSDLPLRG